MKYIVRWTEEYAIEIEADSPNDIKDAVEETDLNYGELVETHSWTFEQEGREDTQAPIPGMQFLTR